ncbi:MAG TPA: hypothetical protein HA264_09595 [Methanolinea sp.]|jgi:hypothetical protein|nr:MAG: hypothetical protein A4E36_00813 [Methanoregulaceae archaeon PtaB.Bin009]OPY42110.1 MAG: hypothetical protein A4E41_00575 [Methanoregulaceae archaeon PtaU1.Bin066]HII77260.1 hypothetical protein [Methanolinea sp.]HNQ29054.1 hypothetical protein [Methanolinea sp.]
MFAQKPTVFKSRAWITVMFIFGIVLIGIGMMNLAFLAGEESPGLISMFISAGFVLTILSGFRLWKGETNYMQDERTKRIGAYGLSWSWFLTFLFLFGIFWADYLHLWSPDAQTLSVLLILFMGISAKGFQAYLFRKGDVD